jgi:hypothetical protein
MTFHICFLASLAPGEHVAVSARTWKAPIVFSRDGFDEAMSQVAPELAIDVPDPHASKGAPIRIDLRFAALRAFKPERLAKDVALLASLQNAESQALGWMNEAPAPTAPGGGGAGGGSVGSSLLDSLLDGEPDAAPAVAPTAGGSRAFDATLAAVASHPEVTSLSRAWNALSFLVRSVPADADVAVSAFAAPREDVAAAMNALAANNEPPDLFVIDHVMTASPRDLELLAQWASAAENASAPAITNAEAALLGFDDLVKLARTERRIQSCDEPRARSLLHVAAKDESRWLMLAMNGGTETSAAVFVGALAARSHARIGWPCALTGLHDGKLENLPVHTSTTSDQIPLEALMPEDVAKDAASAGVAVFECARNADVCILTRAPMLYRGAINASGSSPASSATLPEQLFVARLAKIIRELASELPAATPFEVVREVALVGLTEICATATPRAPQFDVAVEEGVLHITVRPRGAFGIALEEFTLGARLG